MAKKLVTMIFCLCVFSIVCSGITSDPGSVQNQYGSPAGGNAGEKSVPDGRMKKYEITSGLADGSVYEYVSSSKGRIITIINNIPGTETESKFSVESVDELEVVKEEGEGLRLIDRVKSLFMINDPEDTMEEKIQLTRYLNEVMAALEEQEYSFRVSENGEIEGIQGLEKIKEYVNKLFADKDEYREALKITNNCFVEELTKNKIEFLFIPPDEVSVGDTWTKISHQTLLSMDRIDVYIEFRFARVETIDDTEYAIIDFFADKTFSPPYEMSPSALDADYENLDIKDYLESMTFSGEIKYNLSDNILQEEYIEVESIIKETIKNTSTNLRFENTQIYNTASDMNLVGRDR